MRLCLSKSCFSERGKAFGTEDTRLVGIDTDLPDTDRYNIAYTVYKKVLANLNSDTHADHEKKFLYSAFNKNVEY